MNSHKINVKNQALYFDGMRLWSGVVTKTPAGRLFYNEDECFGVYLNEENANVDFRLYQPAIMVLKEAIEENAYGEDRNRGLENAGLDERENQFINLLYQKGEVDYLEYHKSIAILGAKISSRLKKVEAESMFSAQYASLSKEENVENEQ